MRLPEEIVEKLCDVFNYLLDEGEFEPEDYAGYSVEEQKTPFNIDFGGIRLLEMEIVMNERSNGDYDGVQGFNVVK